MGTTMKEIQQALHDKGYAPGPIDGVFGPLTAAAVAAFQWANGLSGDGIPGPRTLERLIGLKDADALGFDDPTLVWFQQARRLMGLSEIAGPGSNPAIVDMARQLDVSYADDDVPWCGLFTAHCLSTLAREPLPADVLRAQAWKGFGVATEPTPGAVMVFWRKKPDSGLGHVGFYAGEDEKGYRILGGNQSNSVSLAWYEKSRFLAARWPKTAPQRAPRPVTVARDEGFAPRDD